MRLNYGISSALILVATAATTAAQASSTSLTNNAQDVIKIPITTLLHLTKRPSTLGRWEHTLRKYGLTTDFGPGSGRGGPQGRQRGRVVEGEHDDDEDMEKVARVPLVDFDFDREYYGTVLVGEPPQSFKIDFDTGSSRFILSSKGCLECSGTTHYDPALSTTFRLNSEDIISSSSPPNNNSNIITTTAAGAGAATGASKAIDTTNPTRYSSRPPVPAPDPNAWHITYGDMSHAEGFLGRDHVTLGGLAGVDIQRGNAGGGRGGLTVQHQELALVTSESANFDDAIDGIMGLAFGALSSSGSSGNTGNRNGGGVTTKPATKTVFENMMSQGLVNKGVFSFYLGKTSRGGGGEVLFGGWDASRIQEGKELVFTNVTRPKYWQINVENVFVEGKRVDYTVVKTVTYLTPKTPPSPSTDNKGGKRSNIAGIMDTGTTLVIVPFRLANAIHELIPGARMMGQSWAVPCNLGKQTHAATGKVELQIEGARFAIPYEDMVREPVERSGGLADEESPSSFDNNPPSGHKANSVDIEEDNATTGDATKGASMKKSSKDGNEYYCFSGIQPSGSNFMIIGDVFIKNNYVVFDQEHQRVGIAPLRLADTLPSEAPEELDVTDGGDEVKDGKKKKTKKEKEKEKKDRKEKEKKKKDEKDEKDEKKDKKEKREARMRVGWEVMNPSSSSEDVVVGDVIEEGHGYVKAMAVAATSNDDKES